LRSGWESVMHQMMVTTVLTACAQPPADIEARTCDYIDASTGILTIDQMQWLTDTVVVHGGRAASPRDYKRDYLRLLERDVRIRTARIQSGELSPDDLLVPGSRELLAALAAADVRVVIISGTDQDDVRHEAQVLGLTVFVDPGCIFGALDDSRRHDKSELIPHLVRASGTSPEHVLVVGDGPVEIRCGRQVGAHTVGVAFDETRRSARDARKEARLTHAGATTVVSDLTSLVRQLT